MILLVGLGNPGPDYQFTRHNVGFLSLDYIAEDHSFSPWKEKFKGLLSEGTIHGHKVLLLKPQTYMNLSGQSVQAAMQFYKIAPEDVIVIHDDLDLAPAKVRMKKGGGHGGHNGLKDIDQRIGREYWRIRLGIGHPRDLGHEGSASNYVLGRFSEKDLDWVGPVTDTLSYHLPLALDKGAESFVATVMQDLSTLK